MLHGCYCKLDGSDKKILNLPHHCLANTQIFKRYVIDNYFGWCAEIISTGRKWNQLSVMSPAGDVSKIVSAPDCKLFEQWFHLLKF